MVATEKQWVVLFPGASVGIVNANSDRWKIELLWLMNLTHVNWLALTVQPW